MQVTNNSKRVEGFHTVTGFRQVKPGETRDLDLSDEAVKLAKRLPYIALGGAKDKAKSETQPNAEGDTPIDDRDELKAQADELGIDYAKNISTDKLREMIDAKLAE
ncbi:hypothetical protein [Mesorhizobium sp. Z1-4]|uniref:hypothetical protein n=1 Tax=Mesorhizobium sp. Z1-4 TaxID=2448478 RepID=UPI000FDA713A|nr:hypothetical protein [Mesorhizobium sp. Z1-4]